ncbi:MAG: hypothetical protein GX611_01260 [Clostridiales bacterium]|nr:hypothetical protein [Clostridiales bacterium]
MNRSHGWAGRQLACWLCCLALLFLCLPQAKGAQQPRITLLVYLCGSDLESKNSAASRDVEEMLQALPKPGDAQVVVMAGGALSWHNQQVSAQETAIYLLTPAGLVQEHSLGPASMGQAGTLSFFLDFGVKQHPADQYALLLWDHGAGPVLGLCFDERFPVADGWDSLSLTELQQALNSSSFASKPLAWIGLDACLMATLEVAQALAPYAAYLIASQETEPVAGWSYDFIRDLVQDADGLQTGRRIVDSYYEKEGAGLSPVTLSCLDLGRIGAVTQAVDSLFSRLGEELTEAAYQSHVHCRVNSKEVASTSEYGFDLVDLKDLLEVLDQQGVAGCSPALSALDQAVCYSRSNTDFLNGLSLYFPWGNPALYLEKGEGFQELAPGYSAFTKRMSEIWLGQSIIDWQALSSLQIKQTPDHLQISLPLSMQQAQGLVKVKLHVLDKLEEGSYAYLHTSRQYMMTPDAVLHLRYHKEALHLVDPAGTRLTGPLTYFQEDGALWVHGLLYAEAFESGADVQAVKLVYRPDDQGAYRLARLQTAGDQPALQGKSDLQLEGWHELQLMRGIFAPARDAQGHLLPISRWPLVRDLFYIDHFLVGEWDFEPRFLPLQGEGDIHVMLELIDIQNRVICTELFPLEPED